jgi:tetratricopeptide (TPR) repeat protein
VYVKLGDAALAEPLFHRALTIAESAFGSDHPLVADVLRLYARDLQKLGRKKEARALERRAAAISAHDASRVAANALVDISDLRVGR